MFVEPIQTESLPLQQAAKKEAEKPKLGKRRPKKGMKKRRQGRQQANAEE